MNPKPHIRLHVHVKWTANSRRLLYAAEWMYFHSGWYSSAALALHAVDEHIQWVKK